MSRHIFVIIAAIAMLTACKEDKKAKLEKLKLEYENIGNEIKSLESDLKNNGDSALNSNNSKVTFLKLNKFTYKNKKNYQ